MTTWIRSNNNSDRWKKAKNFSIASGSYNGVVVENDSSGYDEMEARDDGFPF